MTAPFFDILSLLTFRFYSIRIVQVAVHEFADVMVFAQGITTDSLASLSSAQVQSATTFAGTGSAVTNSVKSALPKFLKSDVLTGKVIKGAQSSTSSEASKASAVSKGTQADKVPATQGQGAGQKKSPTEQVETVGFMPPRREIGTSIGAYTSILCIFYNLAVCRANMIVMYIVFVSRYRDDQALLPK